MPMKTKEEQREYQRLWVAKRRADFFADKQCVRCSSLERLELDHIDPSTKVTNAIWSWAEERRLAEIAKCQVLCHDCHLEKTRVNRDHIYGESVGSAKLTEELVLEIRSLKGQVPYRTIAADYKISLAQIGRIMINQKWTHI